MNRLIAPVLATVCGVCTAYAALGPELQKQAAEREGKNVQVFQQQHDGAIPPTTTPQHPSIPQINNNQSLGTEIKQTLHQAKEDVIQDIQQVNTEVAPKKAWWGLSMFNTTQGGKEVAGDGKDDHDKTL